MENQKKTFNAKTKFYHALETISGTIRTPIYCTNIKIKIKVAELITIGHELLMMR